MREDTCSRCGGAKGFGAWFKPNPNPCNCKPDFAPNPPGPVVGACAPWVPITEADVRRIVREEIAAALAVHMQGDAARSTAGKGET